MNTIHMMFSLGILLSLLYTAQTQYTDPHCDGKQVIVHLFEWKFSDIADECERYLGKKDFCGVQVSPVNEYANIQNRPWIERYNPVSYKITSRSGNKTEFKDMITRCKNVGVRIYVDVVLNHMAEIGRSGNGVGGTSYDTKSYDFPGVPYNESDFNERSKCPSQNKNVQDYSNPDEVRNCNLNGLIDLDQSKNNVRVKIAEFLNKLIDLGVAGFRIDSAKYMWPKDISVIQSMTKDLPEGGRPFFYHDVNEEYNDAIKPQEYYQNGRITELKFSNKLAQGLQHFGLLDNVYDPTWGMIDSAHALVFVDNYYTQRHGYQTITHKTVKYYKMANAFMLAYDYGFPRIMSSYFFGNDIQQGPPHYGDYSIKNVSVDYSGICGNGWVCEHRWSPIGNMVAFRNAVAGTTKKLWRNENDQISFARGEKGFFAMTNDGHMDETLQTGLKSGTYCDLISDCRKNITVDNKGYARIVIHDTDEPIIAFLADRPSAPDPFFGIHAGKAVGHGTIIGTGSGSGTGISTNTGNGTATGKSTGSGIGTSAMITQNTPAITNQIVSTTVPGPNFQRTVIFFHEYTLPGQDLFIRGGIDKRHRTGCDVIPIAAMDPCSIPIKSHDLGTGVHYEAYNAWRKGDDFLDWLGPESHQGTFQGNKAHGSPAVWTTNDPGDQQRYNPLNTYGQHYWLVDIDVDCDKTLNGWFEVKAILNDHWERDMTTSKFVCNYGNVPYETINHWAKCGMKNVFHFNQEKCNISAIN